MNRSAKPYKGTVAVEVAQLAQPFAFSQRWYSLRKTCLVKAMRPVEPLMEFDQTECPFRLELLEDPIQPDAGWVEVPEGPGLVIEINRAVLEKYEVR